jgi:hypothetical protein
VRPAVATAVLGVALAVAAPTTWVLTRPEATAGAPVELALGAPSSPSVTAVQPGGLPTPTARPALPPAETQRPVPVRLAAPGHGVDAAVDAVGVQPDGQMTLPEDVDRLGWYRFGPAPGADEGTAVLAGHVDDADQGLGALAPLRGVEAGAEVQVTDASGAVTRWRVVSRELIEKRAVPLAALFQRTGPPRLVLLTCGGEFLPELRSYADNVVVVAEPAP